jgi:hypothetical protein
MVIVTVLVIMWGVVLAPGIIRRIRTANSERSISSFHHSLDRLESAAPKVVAPAFRLAGAEPGAIAVPELVPLAPSSSIQPRPHLVLLRPPGQGGVAAMNDRYEPYEEYDPAEDPYGEDTYFDDYEAELRGEYPVDHYARREAALRRRSILIGLVAAVVLTGVGGFIASILWMLTVLCAVLLVSYVALMVWAATRGSISLSSPRRQSGYIGERHVARAVLSGHGRYGEEDRYVAEQASYDDDDDEYWNQPRRAAAR